MWMTEVIVTVNRNNVDSNGLRDIASAVADAGGTNVEIDDDNHVIAATLPSNAVLTVCAMEGVTYCRQVFSYYAGRQDPAAA
jgi:hypothetical protein